MGEERTGQYGTESGNPSRTRVSVDGAARALGVTVDAIRKRVQRGTIPHERDEDTGRVWVLLEASSTMQDTSSTVPDNDQDDTVHPGRELLEAKEETIGDLRDRVASLERQLEAERAARERAEEARTEAGREYRRLLARALEQRPAIEAPPEPREAPDTPPDTSDGPSPRHDTVEAQGGVQEPEETARRPWWVRWFGG